MGTACYNKAVWTAQSRHKRLAMRALDCDPNRLIHEGPSDLATIQDNRPATGNALPPNKGMPRSGRSAGGIVGFVRRRPVLVGVLLLALIGTAYFATRGTEEQAGEAIIVEAERGDIENVVTAVGSLQPLKFVDVGAQVSGQLETLHVIAGDEVTKGQLLAEIDATVQTARVESGQAQLQNLRAQLADRQAQLKLAQSQADRQERLKADNATSIEAYDSAQAALQSAEAQVRATQAQIRQSESTMRGDQATLGYSRIFAPIAGTVSSITAKEGQTLNANQQAPTILQIADLTTMMVSTQVSEADIPRLRIGMPAYFTTLGNPDRRWPGRLRQILPTPQVVNNVVMYTAQFDVANPDRQLMTQMTAQVFFVLDEARNAVTVPVSAVRYTDRGAGRANGAGQRGARQAEAQTPETRTAEAAPTRPANGAGVNAGAGPNAGAGAPRGERVRNRQGNQGNEDEGGAPQRPRGRPAVVTVVAEDGTQSERNVVAGVTDRIKVEIISGLEEGERVVAGTLARNENNRDNNNNNNGGRGGFGGPGGFQGRGFGG